MTLYELFHSVNQDVLTNCIHEISSQNDVVEKLEMRYLPIVINHPEVEASGKEIYVLRDRFYKLIVAFGNELNEDLTLADILGRTVMVSDQIKHFSNGKLASYCYCALPVNLLANPKVPCPSSQAFDPKSNAFLTKVHDLIRLF